MQIFFEETIHGPLTPYGADIHELAISQDGSGSILTIFAGNHGSARNVEFDISDNSEFQNQHPLGPSTDGFVSVDFGNVNLELSSSRIDKVFANAAGLSNTSTTLTNLNTGQENDKVSVVGIAISDANFLVFTTSDNSGLAVFQKQIDGSLDRVGVPLEPETNQFSDIVTVSAYGSIWVLATSLTNENIESFVIDATGKLTSSATFGAAEGLGVNTPVSLSVFDLGGQPYVIFASSDTASLSVLRLEPNGTFTAIDHILDDLSSRFDDSSLIETIQIGEDVYVLATGSDDGFSLFQLRPDGKLHLLDTIADSVETTLNNVSAAALVADGSKLRIFLSSANETGLSQFSYDLAQRGINLIASNEGEVITGTSLNDVILGGNGNDSLIGNAGDDLIVDGAGSDILRGGQGADVFTFEPDGADDTILDFERGNDAIDLSHFPLLYDTQDIGYSSTSFGANLKFLGETIHIYSYDGASLSLAEITSTDPFNVDRPALVLSGSSGTDGDDQIQVGTDGNDYLTGTAANDILTGNLGDDFLTGAAGADGLYGGAGFDTANYSTAASGIILDMIELSLNSGDAAGDVFASIEAVAGSNFADQIFGTSSNDTIYGNDGNDQLYGRSGNDLLIGGVGDDKLVGGAGGDQMFGGDGIDLVDYSAASQGIVADLSFSIRNKGNAFEDSFQSIENVTGTSIADKIYGDSGANTLSGMSGDDWISGRASDDTLLGNDGDDILDGGAGSDLLDGGNGEDLVTYSTSKQGLTINLANTAINTGEAAGDFYISIENVGGTRFDDIIAGDGSANILLGENGNDTLVGAGGKDILRGGRGEDVLVGGSGNDLLEGGIGSDVFVFSRGFGSDRISDFNVDEDILELNMNLLELTPTSASSVIENFASTDGSDAVLDFGNGDAIFVEDFGDLSLLAAAITFV